MTKKIVFLSGTRADFGKIKSLLHSLKDHPLFDLHIFITGMHMLKKYGNTCEEIEKNGFKNTHKYINQNQNDAMDTVLAKTVLAFSDYVKEVQPDMIVIHGDRIEALAGAIVGSLNNICVSHIEGGEVSGTVDELIRHAVSKLSHLHFVANDDARSRLLQLGEDESSVFVIGSPDIDIMLSPDLPDMKEVSHHYDINFEHYGVALFHPVTTEYAGFELKVRDFVNALIQSKQNYVVIYPNNDHGSDYIFEEYERIKNLETIKIFPSMRFEYFLTLLKHAAFMIGNSSAGVREAPYYNTPSINIGTRQNNRALGDTIINCSHATNDIVDAIHTALHLAQYKLEPREINTRFGMGDSAEKFLSLISAEHIWTKDKQKYFVDIN